MDFSNKKLIICDLDGTLAPNESVMDTEMADLLTKLMEKRKLAILSGCSYPKFVTQFLKSLPVSNDKYNNLILLPTSGTRMYLWKGSWVEQYAENLTSKEKERVMNTLNTVLNTVGYAFPIKPSGSIIEDRGSQITFSALGQNAPQSEKNKWDKDRTKRQKIVNTLSSRLPEFDIRIGGATSIDITRRGVNKSYGIRRLEQYTGIHLDEMLFIGNTLFPGGNDYPAKASGVDCVQIESPEDTKKIIRDLI